MDSAACGLACHCLLMWKPIRNYFDKVQMCEILVVMTGRCRPVSGPGGREGRPVFFANSFHHSINSISQLRFAGRLPWLGCYGARLRFVNKTSITDLCLCWWWWWVVRERERGPTPRSSDHRKKTEGHESRFYLIAGLIPTGYLMHAELLECLVLTVLHYVIIS